MTLIAITDFLVPGPPLTKMTERELFLTESLAEDKIRSNATSCSSSRTYSSFCWIISETCSRIFLLGLYSPASILSSIFKSFPLPNLFFRKVQNSSTLFAKNNG